MTRAEQILNDLNLYYEPEGKTLKAMRPQVKEKRKSKSEPKMNTDHEPDNVGLIWFYTLILTITIAVIVYKLLHHETI